MKVLLDECLPIDLRHHLPGHEVHTAEWAGFKGLKNGQLLDRAERVLEQRGLATLIVRSRTNQLEDLLPMVTAILAALGEMSPGDAVIVT